MPPARPLRGVSQSLEIPARRRRGPCDPARPGLEPRSRTGEAHGRYKIGCGHIRPAPAVQTGTPGNIGRIRTMRSDRWAVLVERRSRLGFGMTGLLCPGLAFCGDGAALDLTGHWAGHAALAIFAVANAEGLW